MEWLWIALGLLAIVAICIGLLSLFYFLEAMWGTKDGKDWYSSIDYSDEG
jgi:hypothetical protein